jgi:flavin-dependent dehydrogenase
MDQSGLSLEVLIFEPRDFNRPGPGGCNRCAGLLSSRLQQGLSSLGLSLPDEVIQAEVHAYAVHLGGDVLRIEQPDPDRHILSIYRGSGPRLIQGEPAASFDAYLLSQAVSRGAKHVRARVRSINWDGRPVVKTAHEQYPADLLVLATGVNSRAPLSPSFGYRPPQTAVMAQDEVLRPSDWPSDEVSAFFKVPPGLTFGALTPKGRYLNISLLGRNLATDAINDFIDAQGLNPWLSLPLDSLCGCTPRIAIRSAKSYYGNRWVAVGDAAVTRLYKDGIGSAFATAKRAMQAVINHGISRRAIRKVYAPYCRQIARDNAYGRLLFRLWSLTLRVPLLSNGWVRAIQMEKDWPIERRVHVRILWGMFTGDEPYRELFWHSLSPHALSILWRGIRNNST